MSEQPPQSSPNIEVPKTEKELLQEEAKKVRALLRMLNLEKKRKVLTQNKLIVAEKELKILQGENTEEVEEIKYEPFDISQYEALADEELVKKATILKAMFEREYGKRIAARDHLEEVEIKLESLKGDIVDITEKLPEGEVTPVEPVEKVEQVEFAEIVEPVESIEPLEIVGSPKKSVESINLGENWPLSKRAEVLAMLKQYEDERRTSSVERDELIKERDEFMDSNRRLIEGVAKIGNDYMDNEAKLAAAQGALLTMRKVLVATQDKVVSAMDELTETQGRVIATLQELIATQNDLAEANNKLAISEKKNIDLEAQVMKLLNILKMNGIEIQPNS